MNRIRFSLYGKMLAVAPEHFLGGGFNDYLEILRQAGGRFTEDKKGNQKFHAFEIDRMLPVKTLLESAGFEVVVDESVTDLIEKRATRERKAQRELDQRLVTLEAELATRDMALYPYQKQGIQWLSGRRGGLLGDDMGLGKLQPVDSKVLTPSGWREIGSLRPGDKVIGSNGQATWVKDVFPQGIKAVYQVRFSDGSSVEAGDEHLWAVNYRCGGRQWEALTLTTEMLRKRPVFEHVTPNGVKQMDLSRTQLYLPMLSAPVEFDDTGELSIGPYTMGQLIANGYMGASTPVLSAHSDDFECVAAGVALEGHDISSEENWAGRASRARIRGIAPVIRELGLNVLSPEKFIPDAYMTAQVVDRIALLQGLMDADGSITATRNRLTYHTTSKGLANQVQELVECLGGIASVRTYDREAEHKPTEFRVRLRLPSWVEPFRTPRKAERYNPGSHARPVRTVASVEFSRYTESVCIAVEAPDRLYATEHAILTHNTVQALLAVRKQALVVCPATLKGLWAQECRKWRPDLTPVVLKGKNSFHWPKKGELVIVNYDILPGEPKMVGKGKIVAPPPGCLNETDLLVDEAHAVKSRKAARTLRVKALSKAVTKADGSRWPLTGTPILNRPAELWTVLDVFGLAQQAFKSWPNFLKLYNVKESNFGIEWGMPKPEVPGLLSKVMLRRTKAQVLPELPEKTFRRIVVEDLDEDAITACEAVLSALVQHEIDLSVADLMLLSSSDVFFELLSRARRALAAAKIPALLEIVSEYEQAEEPLVVMSAHRGPVEKLGEREGWETILGGIANEQRTEIVERFQSGHLKGIAGTIKAAGVGLTLTRASNMIFVDKEWTPALNVQAEDRVCRIGQSRGVVITSLVADHPIDKAIDRTLRAKERLIRKTLEQHVSSPPPEPALTIYTI